MKQTRLGMLLLSLGVSASMLLSACGTETPTATAVPPPSTPLPRHDGHLPALATNLLPL